jgi:acetyltransferase
LCSAYGIALVRTELASTPQEALEAATEIGLPVVLKSDAPAVSHRAAADAVRLGLDSGPAIEAAYGRSPRTSVRTTKARPSKAYSSNPR